MKIGGKRENTPSISCWCCWANTCCSAFLPWLYQKAKARIQQLKDTKLKPISIQNYEILDTQKQVKLLVFMASIIRYLLLFILLVLTIPIPLLDLPADQRTCLQDRLLHLEPGKKASW